MVINVFRMKSYATTLYSQLLNQSLRGVMVKTVTSVARCLSCTKKIKKKVEILNHHVMVINVFRMKSYATTLYSQLLNQSLRGVMIKIVRHVSRCFPYLCKVLK